MTDFLSAARRLPHLGTWLGLLFTAAGFGLITLAWGKTAGQIDVPLQTPYVMSAGFTGLGLLCLGVTLVAIDVRLRDSAERRANVRRVCNALDELVRLNEQSR